MNNLDKNEKKSIKTLVLENTYFKSDLFLKVLNDIMIAKSHILHMNFNDCQIELANNSNSNSNREYNFSNLLILKKENVIYSIRDYTNLCKLHNTK